MPDDSNITEDEGKPGRAGLWPVGAIVEWEGKTVRVLRNGAGFDEERSRIVVGPGTFREDEGRITKANVSQLHEKRRQKVMQAVSNVFQGAGGPMYALEAIARKQFEIATNPSEERNARHSASWLLQHGGYAPQPGEGAGASDVLGAGALAALADVLREAGELARMASGAEED